MQWKAGENTITIVSTPYKDDLRSGELQVFVQIVKSVEAKLFNGLAQVIIQS